MTKGKKQSRKAKAKISAGLKRSWAARRAKEYVITEEVIVNEDERLKGTIASTLSERGSRYGDFSDNARISQQLKSVLENERSWAVMPHLHREGITMILQKLSRIVNGDPNYKDNWHDIQGYAKLVEDRLP